MARACMKRASSTTLIPDHPAREPELSHQSTLVEPEPPQPNTGPITETLLDLFIYWAVVVGPVRKQIRVRVADTRW